MSLSYQLKGALQLHLFLHHFLLLELFIFSKFVWGVEFKGAPFVFEGRYTVIITDCRWFSSVPSPLAPSPIISFFILHSAFAQLNLLFYKLKKKKNTPKKMPAMQAIVKEGLFLNPLTAS